ncbi:hypothetical protein FQR65_LT14852 [Abscondita terminalis]|nr:hypothetical protein FQR65_LT14852 [Abscondita terminalis]
MNLVPPKPQSNGKRYSFILSEMKTNVRRRVRDVRYGTRGTGGGAAVKSLTDLEERFLALLSYLTVEGEGLPEAGVATSQDLDIEKIPI